MDEPSNPDCAQILEAVTLELEVRDFDLGDMIDSVIAGVPSHERGRVNHSCARRVAVRGDEARLRFVLANLLAMTLGSCRPGSQITINTVQRGRRATVSMLASGQPRDHELIALDVTRKVLEAHGGSAAVAWLKDEVQFCIELPATSTPARTWPAEVRVLLVDDNLQQVSALADLLRRHGLRVDFATTGRNALARLSQHCPDMLIVDLQLPDLDATHIISDARKQRPALPVAVLTGYPSDHPMVARTLASTKAAYLPKPVDVEALLDLVANVVQPRTLAENRTR